MIKRIISDTIICCYLLVTVLILGDWNFSVLKMNCAKVNTSAPPFLPLTRIRRAIGVQKRLSC